MLLLFQILSSVRLSILFQEKALSCEIPYVLEYLKRNFKILTIDFYVPQQSQL